MVVLFGGTVEANFYTLKQRLKNCFISFFFPFIGTLNFPNNLYFFKHPFQGPLPLEKLAEFSIFQSISFHSLKHIGFRTNTRSN